MRNTFAAVFRSIRCFITILFAVSVMASLASGDSKIKKPNVSGQFYDADPARLSVSIDKFFAEAPVTPAERPVEIIIAPHAGYIYSGGVAAYGFKAVSRQKYQTVVILAPSHFVGFSGISIWDAGGFETPLGTVPVDAAFSQKLIESDEQFYFRPDAFASEHSLEVEIPFLQKIFSDFQIVPVVMGQPSFESLERFAAALHSAIGSRRDVLIVVSTDLSHYHTDAAARKMDRRTLEAVKNFQAEQLWGECRAGTMEMCGCMPVTAALLYAGQKGLDEIDVLRYANSGDVTGDRDRVVGYSAVVIYGQKDAPGSEDPAVLTVQQKRRLIAIARQTIEQYVRTGKKPEVTEADRRLSGKEGAFVTLQRKGMLRGCIGNIVGYKPLYLTVRDLAVSAATQDPRFPPVRPGELDEIDVEVSVLSQPKTITGIDEFELGVHGVIVSQGPRHRGVFLPQVAHGSGWTKEEFLSQLCAQKAHLPPDAWKDPKTKIEIFTADVFAEKDLPSEAQ